MPLSKLIRPAARVTHAIDFCRHLSTPVANIVEPIINTDIQLIQRRIKHKVPQKRIVNISLPCRTLCFVPSFFSSSAGDGIDFIEVLRFLLSTIISPISVL